MSRIRLTWANASTTIVEQRVYRSTSFLDINNMPEPLAILPKRDRRYLDNTIEDGLAYYYAVSSVLPDYSELISEQIRVEATPVSDPHWDNVVALLHFDDDFADVKGGAFQAAGTFTYQPGKFSQAIFLTSGDSGVVETAPRAELDLPADFTIEGWMMPTAGTSGAFISRFEVGVDSGSGWQIYLEDNGRLSFYQYVSRGSYPISAVGPDVRDGNWHHVAVTREAGLLRMFVDGVLVGTGSSSASYTSTIARLSVGYQVQGNARYPFRGGIDEVRITKGVARYTENFTPPTEPFPNN